MQGLRYSIAFKLWLYVGPSTAIQQITATSPHQFLASGAIFLDTPFTLR